MQGGVNYFPTTYSSRTHLSYGGGMEGCTNAPLIRPPMPMVHVWFGGVPANAEEVKGSVASMDPTTGKKASAPISAARRYSGVTATAGGLVFTSTDEGTVYALDDATLKPVWSFNTGSFSSAPPMTYSVNGKQYIAILIGGNVQTKGALDHTPTFHDMQNTSMLYVFSL